MYSNNDSHATAKDTKSTRTRKDSSESISDTHVEYISDRRKRKISVNTLNDINNASKQNDDQTLLKCESKGRKQTKEETTQKRNKITSSSTKTSRNVVERSDESNKKRKLYLSKNESDLSKQIEVENINYKSRNKPVGDLPRTSDMDNAFDRLKMMSPYSEQIPDENAKSDYTMKLRSHADKLYNLLSDNDDDDDNLNNNKFANRIREKSSSRSLKKSSVKKPKTIIQKRRPFGKMSQAKINNPLIDERVRKSQTEVLDTSITNMPTYKDDDKLLDTELKPQHIYPEITIVPPEQYLNDSFTSITSLNIEVEEPNVTNRYSDNFLTKVKNIFKTYAASGTNTHPTNNVSSSPNEIVEICDEEQQPHHDDPMEYVVSSSLKKHNKNKPNKQKFYISPSDSKAEDALVLLEEVQCDELNDCTSSLHFQKDSRTEQNNTIIKLLKDIKEQNEKFLADIEKDTESLLDMLLIYDKQRFKKYVEECEKQKEEIIDKLKTSQRESLERSNESFKNLEELLKKTLRNSSFYKKN